MIRAYAATNPKGKLERFDYDPGPLKPGQVEVKVDYCGICHSDLSMLNNDWGFTQYPFVPGHEIAGTVLEVGEGVTHLKKGDAVGIGWYSGSCLHCRHCMSGDHNFCAESEGVIVGRHGGFADKVRAQAAWTLKLPRGVDPAKAGPLFCGGSTVFNPIVQFGVKPTDRVGVIGIGGLGHLALQFLKHWGCEVTAFSSNPKKTDEIKKLGATNVVSSTDVNAIAKLKGALDFILVTANVPLPWDAILSCLAPNGRLNIVGAVLEPIPVAAFSLIGGQKTISGSPVGSPSTTATMLDFCARHNIAPVVEEFPMSKVNEAMEHLHAGKARYRVVLKAGF
ncbi:MAG: NAD(P)-dependent alcohol dehydrogenase [Alphaproteobacteria bacterium]|nr:NAD(P)-dependent alcohol dehydrogenase [Alphaproteobacteria bacterium]